MEQLINKISESVPRSENEYVGKDGLRHCSKCGGALEMLIDMPLVGRRKVGIICKCIKAEQDAYARRLKQEEHDRRRNICFSQTNMKTWSFENDDRKNPKMSDAMMRYAEQFADFKSENKGLLLYGTVGTGKTYYAACIANYLIDHDRRVLMTNFARLANEIQGMFDGKQAYIDSLNRYDLIVIDDLGAERKSEFMQEMVFNIIDARYRSGLPLIVTTNLTAEELKNPSDVNFARIYDRILERCFPVEVAGPSRRRAALKDTHVNVKAKLGL